MIIQCECGKFRAELLEPTNTPGRLKCYCDDCQTYAHHLGRKDLLDANGGSEVLPFYPTEIRILSGADQLTCTRLSEKGPFRFSTKCCKSPIVNVRPGTPWMAVAGHAHTSADRTRLDKTFGPVRSSIMGLFAKGERPKGVPNKLNLKAFLTVMPHMMKGSIKGKKKSPFFKEDGVTPIADVEVLTPEQMELARTNAGF